MSDFLRRNPQPWEWTFADACAEACYSHRWKKSLKLFELAVETSGQEAAYFWWYTALLASQGKLPRAIDLLRGAVEHFSRTNIATRTDMALLQVMAGQFSEAEEILLSSLDFISVDNPLVAYHLAILYEAQDRLEDATTPVLRLLQADTTDLASSSIDAALERRDGHALLTGMGALLAGRQGAAQVASAMLEILLDCKAKRPAASSLEIALACIGLGKLAEAVNWLERAAFEEDDPFAMWFHIFPPLRHLRKHPGYKALLKRLRLPLQRVR